MTRTQISSCWSGPARVSSLENQQLCHSPGHRAPCLAHPLCLQLLPTSPVRSSRKLPTPSSKGPAASLSHLDWGQSLPLGSLLSRLPFPSVLPCTAAEGPLEPSSGPAPPLLTAPPSKLGTSHPTHSPNQVLPQLHAPLTWSPCHPSSLLSATRTSSLYMTWTQDNFTSGLCTCWSLCLEDSSLRCHHVIHSLSTPRAQLKCH